MGWTSFSEAERLVRGPSFALQNYEPSASEAVLTRTLSQQDRAWLKALDQRAID